jgi:molybdopterin-guanine dinucleotide biosynthesis protein A
VEFDAIILAGGRSSRLGGVPKARLTYDGATLLARSLRAAGAAGHIVVVGPDPGDLPGGILNCREEPPFAGPAAAIAAGLSALAAEHAGRPGAGRTSAARSSAGAPAPFTLVLACDMPRSAAAVSTLAGALTARPGGVAGDGVMAVSADGRKQPLAGFYGTAALQRSAADAARGGGLENASVFALLARLDVREVRVPPGSTDDVDTWDDATALGVSGTIPDFGPGSVPGSAADRRPWRQTVKSQDETLEDWCRALLQALELEDVEIDVSEVLALAGVAAHAVVRPAAPLTTFIAGFAAGLASGSGQATDEVSMQAAMAVARQLAKDHAAAEASGA